jgi:hypothetical protein
LKTVCPVLHSQHPTLHTNMRHLNPVEVAITYFSQIHFNVNLSFTPPKLPFPSGLLFKVGIQLQPLSCMPHAHIPHPITLFKLITFYCFFIRISGINNKWATAVRIFSFDILIHISWLGVTCQWDHKGMHVDTLINDSPFNYRELITRPLKLALERWVGSQVNKQIFPRRGLL